MTSPATAPLQAMLDQDGDYRPWTPKLKLQGLGPNDLPPHSALASHQTSPPELSIFLQHLFFEVHQHFAIKSSDIGTSKNSVTARGTTFPVVVHKTKCIDEEGLLWFGRRSEHDEGKPVAFEELREVLMRNHERNEAEYTPAIYDVNVLVDWDGDLGGREFGWEGGSVERVEMRSEFYCFTSRLNIPPIWSCQNGLNETLTNCSNPNASQNARSRFERPRIHRPPPFLYQQDFSLRGSNRHTASHQSFHIPCACVISQPLTCQHHFQFHP